MAGLPTGTVTFLFTDIEGSTRLLQDLGEKYLTVLEDQRRLLHSAFRSHGGREVDTQGDALFYAFHRASDAVCAAIAAQRAITAHAWPDGILVRIRTGLHTGEALQTETGYAGIAVHRAARICAAAHGGQILVSQATRELIADAGPDGMNLLDLGEHRLKDLSRPQHLFQVVAADLPVEFPTLHTLDSLPNNLPRQLTSFIGRDREITEIKELLERTVLLTLTGVGGSGKTRLALQVAADVVDHYPDGVWWVPLAPLSEPSLIPQAVASAMGIREQRGRPLLDVLLGYLGPKALLLALDNVEHMLAGSAECIDALLRRCSGVRILVTSREPLKTAGEHVYPVPPLPVPSPGIPLPITSLAQADVVRLFLDRATAARPSFALNAQNAAAVIQICRRVDGIPLAVELAAARVKVLSAEQIAARLDDQFRLLTSGSTTALPRHQTLQAAMDWSYDLLSEKEKVLFRRLSVFAGGLTLEAAEGVCAGDSMQPTDILDLLTELVDKSLVMVETQQEQARYRLLETVRQYSSDRLVEAGEAAEVRRRHRGWYLGLAERADPKLRGPYQAEWLERLETEHDNLRAALEWSKADPAGAEAGLRLAGALEWFWHIRCYLTEGREWLQGAIARGSEASVSVRAKALSGAGALAFSLGEYREAEALLEHSLALFQEVGDTSAPAYALHHLAHVADAHGDYARARILFERSLASYRDVGETWGVALSSCCLGDTMYHQGDYSHAMRLLEESLALFREVGDKWGLANVLASLGLLAGAQGDYERAKALLEEGLAIVRLTGDKMNIAVALDKLANVSLREGDIRRAVALYSESLLLRREVGVKRGVADCLAGLAKSAAMLEHPKRAARLFGAAEALREVIHGQAVPNGPANLDAYIGATRRMLGEKVFTEQWAEGRAKPLERVMEDALAPIEPPPVTGVDKETAGKHVHLLTTREREVAALVARGFTNRGIATLLVITERTAETHVLHILNKLGFNSRAQIAAWANAYGLTAGSPD